MIFFMSGIPYAALQGIDLLAVHGKNGTQDKLFPVSPWMSLVLDHF
tara:strand:- start:59 stop:196 length:138 start_codon:yes stop_codon:yes gene_type:complete